MPHQISDVGRPKISSMSKNIAQESGLKDSELYRITSIGSDYGIEKKIYMLMLELKSIKYNQKQYERQLWNRFRSYA